MNADFAITDERKQNCIDIINNLEKHKISELFFRAPNPETDFDLPEKYPSISSSMTNFSIVREKVEKNEYKTISEFKAAVEAIWDFYSHLYSRDSLANLMMRQLKSYYKEQTEFFFDNPTFGWAKKLDKLRLAFSKLSKSGPGEIFTTQSTIHTLSSSNSGNLPTKEPSTNKKKSSSTSKPKPKKKTEITKQNSQENNQIQLSTFPQPNSQPFDNQLPVQQQQQQQTSLPEIQSMAPSLQHQSFPSIQTLMGNSSFSERAFTQEEIDKLQEDIQNIATDDSMPQMIEIIKENEENVSANGEEVEVDLIELKPKTLQALRLFVDKMMREKSSI